MRGGDKEQRPQLGCLVQAARLPPPLVCRRLPAAACSLARSPAHTPAVLGFSSFQRPHSLRPPPSASPALLRRPAISALVAQITQHLSAPDGNHQLALTFQPLVNMALQLQASRRTWV